MRRSTFAFAAAALVLVSGCSGTESAPPPADRSAVQARISSTTDAAVAPAQPDDIELRSPDGVTYMSSPVNPDGLYRNSDQVLNPVDELPAWWAESGLPGTDTQETVVVAGHNYSKRDAPFKALAAVQPGDSVVLETSNGTLQYTVESVGPLPKGLLLSDNELRRQVPGRLILANCDVRGGEPTNDNYIVVAQLPM